MLTGFGSLHVHILILHCMIFLCSFGTILDCIGLLLSLFSSLLLPDA